MNKTELERKMRGTNTFNLWNMIVTLVVEFCGFFVMLPTLIPLFALASKISQETNATDAQAFELGRLIGTIILTAFLLAVIELVMHIILAVKNNNYEIKRVYNQTGVGQAPAVLSIISIFFFGWIFAIIVYVMGRKALTSDTSKIEIKEN